MLLCSAFGRTRHRSGAAFTSPRAAACRAAGTSQPAPSADSAARPVTTRGRPAPESRTWRGTFFWIRACYAPDPARSTSPAATRRARDVWIRGAGLAPAAYDRPARKRQRQTKGETRGPVGRSARPTRTGGRDGGRHGQPGLRVRAGGRAQDGPGRRPARDDREQPSVQPRRDSAEIHLSWRRDSPAINWSGAPQGTKSLALVVDDSAAPITPYIYWIVFDIGPQTTGILDGQLPPGARQAGNSKGTVGYDPPCPHNSSHKYRFTVYALGGGLQLPGGTSAKSAWTAIAQAAIARGTLLATANP